MIIEFIFGVWSHKYNESNIIWFKGKKQIIN